jgi:Ran GTPase-activating protein (RanGAP) involved in mRNA processing and transport
LRFSASQIQQSGEGAMQQANRAPPPHPHCNGLGGERNYKIKVFDTLEEVQACLLRNEDNNLILYPRYHADMDDADADALARALEANTSLLTLSLEEVHIGTLSGVHRIANALAFHRNFKRLTLYDNRLGDEGVAVVMQAISKHRNVMMNFSYYHAFTNVVGSLQSICICGNLIGDQGAYWIAQGIVHNPAITEVDLSSNEIRELGATYLANSLTRSNLTTLILNANEVGAKGAVAIARALQVSHQMSVVGLCGNDIGDDGAVYLCEVAKTHPGLKALLLEDNYLGERGIVAVAEAHRANRHLGMMEVSWNCVTPGAMKSLCEGLGNIFYLYLDHCEIGDAHMETLGNGLRSNNMLRDLFLEGNQIGLRGTRFLANALTKNDCLEGLFLDGNCITNEGAYLLRDLLRTWNMRLRRLQIHDNYHDVQREIDVYLDMNGAGRRTVLQARFPSSLWPQFLAQKEILSDPDLIYLFLKERPELFQRNFQSKTKWGSKAKANKFL